MNRFFIVIYVMTCSLASSGQSYSSVVQQNRIDSLIDIGENLFTADQKIIFKYESNLDSPAALIEENDLMIVLKKVDEVFYEVEWDNKIGYIFQLDISPYNLLSEDHYLEQNPLNNIEQSVRYDSVVDKQIEQEGIATKSEQENESKTETTEPVEVPLEKDKCWIQFFASRYSDKRFDHLNDLGTITATTDLRDKLTRYRLSIVNPNFTCAYVIEELSRRGFTDAFNVYQEQTTN